MPVRILFIGDMHLGLGTARLPENPADRLPRPADLGSAAAWSAAVDWALGNRIDAVALAGDVCDSSNSRWEAYAQLKAGAERLAAAGVRVCAVAGNHDGETLPRLAADLSSVMLLGEGGHWSSVPIDGADSGHVHLVGWSFPRRHWTESPLVAPLPAREDDHPRLGLLHCHLDAASSDYAPVRRDDLAAADVDRWFLGHVHAPSLSPDGRRPGYLGSLTGLDPSETGRRGPWLVEITGAAKIGCRQVPLAPLRWERLELVLDHGVDGGDAVESALRRARSDRIRRLREAGELDAARAVGFRLELTGTYGDLAGLDGLHDTWAREGLAYREGDLPTFLDSTIVNRVRSRLDLDEMAGGSDLPALLARKLVALRAGDGAGRRLVSDARPVLQAEANRSQFSALGAADLTDDEIRDLLLAAGQRALEETVRQRKGRA